MRFQSLSLTTPSANVAGAAPATPPDFCYPCNVRYDYSGGGGGGASLPVAPAAPTFTGTERFVGSSGGDFATLALAVAASAPGDIITVRAGYNSTETPLTTVNVNKSLEIRGQNRATSQVTGTAGSSGGNFVITIPAGVNDVYIHDLTITNLVTAAQDGGGISSNIGAGTMTNLFPNGSTGLRFERLNLVHWKFGVSISGSGWVINDCAFSCRLASAGTTIRHVGHYGQTGDCFITNCAITPTTDATPRSQFLYMTTNYAGNAQPYRPGQAGNLVMQNITTVGAGNYNAYYLQDVMHEPGLANVSGGAYTNPATPGSFSLWFDGTSFSNPYSGNPCSVIEATDQIAPLSFFNVLYFKNVVGAARTTGDAKGFFAVAGSTGSGRSIGAPVTGLYVSGTNTFGSILPSTTYAEGSTIDNLLGVLTTNFTVSSPIAPVPAATLAGLITVDGVLLVDGDRVFVVSSEPIESGIYSANVGAWYRSQDMIVGDDAAGDRFTVTQGTTYANTNWLCTNTVGNGIVGTDALSFAQV
jgi:hypothetical protein